MKVLVFGNGWLGNKLVEHFGGVMSKEDILDIDAVNKEILSHTPDVVINSAAKCGQPNIDWCELPENRYTTKAVNTFGPLIIEHVCKKHGVKFVQLSSGCLWEWGEDIDEKKEPEPPSFYSETKAEAECRLDPKYTLMIRPRMPVDGIPHPRNLITKLTGYDYVLSVPNSVTIIDDLLWATGELINKGCAGVYNVVNKGPVTGEDIITMYCKMVDDDYSCRLVDMDFLWDKGLITAGRSNVVLNIDKLSSEGIEMPDAMDRICDCMQAYALMVSV